MIDPKLEINHIQPTSALLVMSATPDSLTPVRPIPKVQTMTPSPTQTNYHTLTPSPSPQQSFPAELTTMLSREDAQLMLNKLLTNNGDCLLPCLWGIVPGVSKSQDAQYLLEALTGISNYKHFGSGSGSISLETTLDKLKLIISFDYLADKNSGMINSLFFEARVFRETMGEDHGLTHIFDSNEFGQLLGYYMLSGILTEYGRPDEIYVSTFRQPPPAERGGDTGAFLVILIYPDQGVLVQYQTSMLVNGEYISGCINNAHITMELFPPGNGETFVEYLDPTLQSYLVNNFKPLSEVTVLSIDDFYQTFQSQTNECLETPSILWPVPGE
jgi:hypothetical protein